MSTKSSLVYVEFNEVKEIHIYHDMIDDLYYIETQKGRIEIPKRIAEEFAKVMEEKFSESLK